MDGRVALVDIGKLFGRLTEDKELSIGKDQETGKNG